MKFNHSLFVSAYLFCLIVVMLFMAIITLSVYTTGSANLGMVMLILSFLFALIVASYKGLN